MSTDLSPPGPPQTPAKAFLMYALFAVVAVLAAGFAWWLLTQKPAYASENAIQVIAPYNYEGTWVFDDARVGLQREPFVAGIPEMIDLLVADIPNAKQGFRLLFAAQPFPGYQKQLVWLRGDMGGNYYQLEGTSMEGWICPAMFRYYSKAPANLYVKAEAK